MIAALVWTIAVVVMSLAVSFSQPTTASAPPPAPTPLYIAEHPSQFSVWEVHKAVQTLQGRQP
jgi:hypothetical protein